ncbi:hypothetical protein PISL3812_08246 [Talaromyces islandicus]|uniref:gamma-glutamylcyclotransferase n=1 Tax=Talaromyces islandicus TaxID=28573 RepID=A0A0U1M6L5_TALIS|nr:hypothetical protein PISL3812_08246 [Talaromyces islandicus]
MASRLPRIPAARLAETTNAASTEADVNLDTTLPSSLETEPENAQQKTVLYLAYGSNLSVEKFRKQRGINPLSQINVYVPELKLTFDLAGVPYMEPCFAGSRYRSETNSAEEKASTTYRDEKEAAEECVAKTTSRQDDEKRPLVEEYHGHDYHKDRWHKPLIGVVYEVTLKDYAHIIATEGGGQHYRQVTVTCFPFAEKYDSSQPTPDDTPKTTPFKARTLLSPWKPNNTHNDPLIRPDPSYAQPSARYLQLLMDGARELDFPQDYRHFLANIRPYTITTWRQRIGKALFLARWLPVVMAVLGLQRAFADDRGIMPPWVARLQSRIFKAMWRSYDVSFRGTFGDGERTIGDV